MKQLICLSVFFVFSLAMTTLQAQEVENNPKNQEVMIQTSAQCEMCKERITEALAFAKGVKKVEMDMETKVVTVLFNGKKTDTESLKEVIAKTGYQADEVEADQEAYDKLPACCQLGGGEHH